MRRRCFLLVLMLAAVMLVGAVPFPPESPIERAAELVPAKEAVNDQRGFAIAMDGDWLAIGARLEDVDGLDNAGAVHLFQFDAEKGTWREKDTLTSQAPQMDGQFGFAISLRNGTLAVGAIGESKVDVFTRIDGEWTREESLPAPPGAKQFGSSVAVDGPVLAVGAADPHGEAPGAVYVYSGASWAELPPLAGDPARPDERFGRSVAVEGSSVAVGAPGADDAKGAFYLFDLVDGAWQRSGPLTDPALAEGDQLGLAVAMDGQDVVVGAPMAGGDDAGAAWVLRRGGGGLTRLPGSSQPGDQLGYAVAIDGDRIAVGAPAPFEGRLGSVHVFTRSDGTWSGPLILEADNADPFGLAGFSVAVSGEWVMAGAMLGDYGGDAIGSISSFRCRAECVSKGDVVVKGKAAAQERFGISVAADGDFFAVGAFDEELGRGSVTVFRRATEGWRQEARLKSPEDRPNEFGASVAVHHDPVEGDLLAVGDPRDPGGTVFLYRKNGETWGKPEATLLPPVSIELDEFGRSLATDGETLVIGAAKAAYAFKKQDGTWQGAALDTGIAPGADFGVAVAVQGDTIAVGAPHDHGPGRVYVFQSAGGRGCSQPAELLQGEFHDLFGFAVALDGNTLAVGAPWHDAGAEWNAGAVHVYERSSSSTCSIWSLRQSLPDVDEPLFPRDSPHTSQGFGFAVDLRGEDLVVGAPLVGPVLLDIDHAYLFQLRESEWHLAEEVDAAARILVRGVESPPVYDGFGTGVAIGEDFFVVTSPSLPNSVTGGERVAVFELRRAKEEEP